MDTGACTKGVAVITGVMGSWGLGVPGGCRRFWGSRGPGDHGEQGPWESWGPGGHQIWVTGNKKPGGILGFWGAGFLEAAKSPAAVGWGRFWGQGSKFQEYFLTR